ncbi:alanyl-tRNA editing protein [Parasedimentitalea maritima]|uniref:Alanine--tRNA ligase n=1 Tax=Parasedimentitalea maritima TaxID=2578117 RepID=A0A6A4RDI0_9RHOB|nr:alanyl-tRNA editing protein [Zongyanglinia marina]KAE9628599.1 alanyl-tRNA editing protein [Zongyanglinia marina]
MTTNLLFQKDAYLREAPAEVLGHTDQGGVVLDQTLFYATGGGQPGDGGLLEWDGGSCTISTAVKGENSTIILVPAEGQTLPPVGASVTQKLDWTRRNGHMRVHTALHLLSVVIPLPVSGGSIGAEKGRLDFNMPEAPDDKAALQDKLQTMIDLDLEVSDSWISDAELDANPQMIKTMSVSPPRGAGQVRLVQIGAGKSQVDLQPCGGTHVRRTAEIGKIRLGKVEKKGKLNRRVYLHLDD